MLLSTTTTTAASALSRGVFRRTPIWMSHHRRRAFSSTGNDSPADHNHHHMGNSRIGEQQQQQQQIRPTEFLRAKRERELLEKQRRNHLNRNQSDQVPPPSSPSPSSSPSSASALDVNNYLVTKRPSDSHLTLQFPFSTDSVLRDAYTTMWKEIRIGKILEELDSMAGEIAYRHCDGFDAKRPLTLVTASVDRIELLKPLRIDRDMRIDGNVTWVGNSSMEIRIEVQVDATPDRNDIDNQNENNTNNKNNKNNNNITTHASAEPPNYWERAMVAIFTMVARDKDGKSAPVNRLDPQTDLEKELFATAHEAKQARKAAAMQSLSKQPPNEEEKLAIHSLFLETQNLRDRIYDPAVHAKYFFMKDSVFNKSLIMHPQERNIHCKIFGGYLLREAFDLGWICAYAFAKKRPLFLVLDDNHFLKPVELGSILRLTSQVVFAKAQTCQVRVEAEVMNPSSGVLETTNIFHFTWAIPPDSVREIVPESYEEAIFFLEGRRLNAKGKQLSASTPHHIFYK